MRLYRVFKREHAATACDGEGARIYGGRWNSKGIPVVYAACAISLAILEMLVNANTAELLPESCYAEIEAPDEMFVESIGVAELPPKWHESPAPGKLAEIGDAWLASASSAVLLVPSAVTKIERNALLNPKHRDFKLLTIGKAEELPFDRRLLSSRGID